MDGDLIDAEDEGNVIMDLRALRVVLDLEIPKIKLISAVFMSIAFCLNSCSPLMELTGL